MDTNFLLPWLNKQSFLPNIPNNPLDKLKNSSSLNNPNGGFLKDTAPMSIDPRYAKKPSTPPMSIAPKISRQAPMSVMPKTTFQDFQLPSFTDFQNQNFIPNPLKSFTPTYIPNQQKPKLEIPTMQGEINKKNKIIANDYNAKRNAIYSFMADVKKNEGSMSREMIEEFYPEFVDNIDSALQLQAEIAPIVAKGEEVKLTEIKKYYPELLSDPKFLKKSEIRQKDNEAKNYLKKISKVDQNVLSNEGKKWINLIQGMQELADQTRLQYQVPKDITDTEITNYLISNNPELKKRYQEGINAKLTDYDKAQLKLGGNWMNKFSATAQNLTHRANAWLSKNVIEPYMQASEEFKESNPNLSAINAPVKALLQIPGGLLHGTDKALSSMQRLANADYQSSGEIIGDGIKGLGGGGEVVFNTALAPLTAKFHTLGGTKAGKVVLDNTFGLLEEGLENIFQAPGVSKLYNALDEEARIDLKNGIIIGLLHKGNKATENTRFNAKMAIKTATDAFNNAIQKGVNSGRFQTWVEKGLAHENGRFQDGALGRIVKEGVSEFQSAFKENLGKFNDVINARRQQVNTLADKRGFVETTKSEIKEGVDTIKIGTKNVIGGIKKKINDLNTKSQLKQGEEIKEGFAGSSDKINTENSSQKFSNFNRKLLQNQNRIDPSKIVEFEKRTNQKYGDYMLERGRVGGPEENIAKMTKHINDLKEQKKQAFEKMSGTAQSEAVGTLLTDIVERATQVRDPQTVKFTTMLTKHNEGGISFSELEEAKRRYEKNIKTGYYKDNNSVGIQRATNLDTEIREYQQKEAIKQGFQNIKELNKEISNTYFLSNEILRKQLKMDANNQVSLTDYLLLGAMPDNVAGFAGLALKIAMKNKSIKNNMLHVVAKMFGNHKNSKEIKTDLDRIEKIADQKAVADAIERFMKKWDIKETPALPRFPEATIVGKNGPQVKNPLSPQPTKRSVIEIDKRPKDTNKSDKGNIVGLKKTTKSGKKENSEYNEAKKVGVVQPFVSLSSESESTRTTNFTKSNNTPSVSLTEKRDKVVGLKVGSSGATSRGGDSGRPTTDFSKLEKTKSVGGNFDISKIDKEYSSNYDKIVNGEGDNLAVGKIDGKVAYDGRERHAIFSQFIKDKIDADHGLDKGNLLATINEPDYIIKNVDGKIDKINIIKGIEGSNDFVLVGADRQNGYFILSNYEVKSRNNKRLAKSLGRGEIVIDNIGDGKTLAKSEKQNIVGLKVPKEAPKKGNIVGGIKTGNSKKSEHTMGDKETAQPAVSFSSENEPVLGVSFFAKEKGISSKKKNIIGLFSEQIGGAKQDGLNPNALPLSDYKAMQSLEGLTTPLQKKDMQWYITEKIAQDKGANKFGSPEEMDVYSDIAGLVKDMLYEHKNGSIEEANKIATSLFEGENAKSIINTYTEKYNSDLKVYEGLSKKYPGFEEGKIDLGKSNNYAEKSQRVESGIYEEAKKYKTAEDFMASKGELLYHGSPNKFDTFSKHKIGTTTDQGVLGKGFYFANKEYFAKGFAKGENGNIIKVRINSDKLFDINSLKTIEQASKMFQMDENAFYRASDGKIIPKNFKYALEFGEKLQEMGFDGAYLNRNADLKETVIFNPEVIQTEKELLKIRNKAQSEKKSNILGNLSEPKREAFETLPSDVDFLEESKKVGPKRIAPDRKAHQQLDPQTALEKLADKEKDRLTGKIKGLREDLATLNKLVEKYGEKMPARTEKNRKKYPDLIKDYSEMQQLRTRYQSNSADGVRDIIKRIIDNNTHNLEELTPEDMKKEYIALVQEDISKGYKYPEAVLDFVPEARKILNGRERYEKVLYTSFSAKDERINYEYKEKLGAGMKRQDGKELTQEQKQDIMDGVEDFGKILGLDMKKLGEEKSWVYVHLNGKNVFLKNGVAGLYREKGENISISVGGTESVRQTIGGEVGAVKIHPTMAHELGHALDGIQNWKLFPSSKLFDLKIKMNKAPNGNTRYWKSDSEVTARAIEQYIAIKKGNTDYYDKPAYWKKEVYESIIKPMVKQEIEEKFEWYMKGGEHSKPLPKTTQDSENAMIWVSDKTSKKMHELSEKYPSAGKNELDKIGKLNSGIKKSSGKRSEKDKEIYRVKDDILLDDIIEKGISIKDEGPNTTYTLEQDGVYVTRHLGDRVMRILREKGLLK